MAEAERCFVDGKHGYRHAWARKCGSVCISEPQGVEILNFEESLAYGVEALHPDWVDVVLPSLPCVTHHLYPCFGVVCTWASMPAMWANDFLQFAGIEA